MIGSYVKLIQGEPPIYLSGVEYRIVGWGEKQKKYFVYFNTGVFVLSSPVENVQTENLAEFIENLKAQFPKRPMGPIPECSL